MFTKRKQIMLYSIIIIISSITTFLLLYFFTNKTDTNKTDTNKIKSGYKGLVLFDVDGTLTTSDIRNSTDIVQACIDNNFAVGICTAGSGYTINTEYPSWLPKNLYDFIIKHDNITFNNVNSNSNILMGKKNANAYSKVAQQTPGYLKGFALEQTANYLGITNKACMILCDDDDTFINDVHKYDKDLTTVCSGNKCGKLIGKSNYLLNMDAVKKAMTQC